MKSLIFSYLFPFLAFCCCDVYLSWSLFLTPVYAEPESPHAVAAAVADEINSPFCPGRLLRDCPSGAATDLKRTIEVLAQQGHTKAEIIDELVKRYGDPINPVPSFRGIGILAWIGPIVFLVLGGAVLGIKLVRSMQSEEREEDW
jgi:cytochrome c-type biogenesis protein CcmH